MPDEARQTDRDRRDSRRAELAETIYRLFETAVTEESGDAEIAAAADDESDRLRSLGEDLPGDVSVLFHEGGIFVNGELLKSDRDTYENFADLEAFLAKFRCNEIALAAGFSRDDVEELMRTFREMERHPLSVTEPVEPNERLRIHYIKPAERVGLLEPLTGRRPLEVRIARYYGACLQTLRAFHRRDRDDKQSHIRGIKRIAQVLVHLSGRSRPAMLSLTGMPESQDEFCGVVLNSAILALLMARRLTGRIEVLRRICFAALTIDAANRPDREEPPLPGQGERQTAAESAATVFRSARTADEANRRALAVHETHTLLEQGTAAAPYDSTLEPKIETLIITVARRYTYLSAERPETQRRPHPDEVVQSLLKQAETRVERVAVHLLVDTLGLFTQGMPVELSSGWRAIVVSAADHITNFHLPTVRLARAPDGEWIAPRDVDLTHAAADDTYGYVARRIDAADDERLLDLQRKVLEEEPLRPE